MNPFFYKVSDRLFVKGIIRNLFHVFLTILPLLIISITSFAQTDSAIETLQQIPLKYISTIDKKVDKYSNQITSKTEKTLQKLSRWENKIKGMLEKVSPEAAQKLFGEHRQTFGSVLQRIKEGKRAMDSYKTQYDAYRDQVTTDLKYLSTQKKHLNQKILKTVAATSEKMNALSEKIEDTQALEQFIKERKNQLIDEAIRHIGKSKYLQKINKETWYYVESMKNYKQIFSDPKKIEQTAKTILNKIPAFEKFVQKNSVLASLFGGPEENASAASIAGLQTRASVQSLIQGRISAGGPNAMQQVQQNMQQAKGELMQLKDKMLNALGDSGGSLPDFKPNMEKTKTFMQRLEYGSNFQFGKSSKYLPTTADIGFSIGYKINDKSVAGIGASYKMGLGNFMHIRLSNQGAGIRSFIDWKLKKQFFITGGMEMNYLATLPVNDIMILQTNIGKWQQAGLLGISKKISVKTKWFKDTKVQLLWDFLSNQHLPVSQPVLFRVGYIF